MSCTCNSEQYHSCQNGGECKCGGKCIRGGYYNAVGSIDEFRKEEKNVGKAVLQLVGGLALAILALIIYSKLNN